jgi:2-amino-4-hydroxy-6-hydroxymethyldihydropteridine diphosphokinase
VGEVLKVSRFFKSKPWGFSSQNEFVNCCCMVRSSLSVDELMIAIQNIESRLGRQRIENDRYEDRVIDIDVIFFDNCIINKPNIRIPHKDFRKRDFVLLPLLNLANEIDPETFITISQFTK